jgi:hypothetical protein
LLRALPQCRPALPQCRPALPQCRPALPRQLLLSSRAELHLPQPIALTRLLLLSELMTRLVKMVDR